VTTVRQFLPGARPCSRPPWELNRDRVVWILPPREFLEGQFPLLQFTSGE